jgi:hypothetical protein
MNTLLFPIVQYSGAQPLELQQQVALASNRTSIDSTLKLINRDNNRNNCTSAGLAQIAGQD